MTQADHVTAIHIINEKNPQPNVLSARFGVRAGRARQSTRIKLADTQRIVALAEVNDGSFWTETADVVVNPGCLCRGPGPMTRTLISVPARQSAVTSSR